MSDATHYLQELIRHPSPSLQSNEEVSRYVASALEQIGFETACLPYRDPKGQTKVNVVAKKGTGNSGLTFFAHTDTVPADRWFEGSPFEAKIRDGRIYGRGACDMKGPIAAMLTAASRFQSEELVRPVYICCTADEEVGYHGAQELLRVSQSNSDHPAIRIFQEMLTGKGIVSEPTCLEVVHAHKGTSLMRITSRGRAAHSSTNKGLNANLAMIPFLAEMKGIHDELDDDPHFRNPDFDPPTSGFNIGISDYNPTVNITPERSVCTIYYRPMPGDDFVGLTQRVETAAKRHGLEYELVRTAPPMFTDPNSDWVRRTLAIAGKESSHTVPYGTDGALFGQYMPLVVFGPGDIAQAHTVDEWISLEQLNRGVELYTNLIREMCVDG